MNETEKFDIILNLEVVEHVDNVDLFIESCSLLKKNGIMFTATPTDYNFLPKSYCGSRVCS